ncbi:hypothetical protein [Acinetobacter pittii]|uniref:hypothetical protein n=1 Tax=Acinetobacter pittii TaxID=48296 RepID=UPI000C7628FF|nr:hypothetical protein [Acinetobacter pittii]AUM28010.1 hypothetical protein BVD86_14605 [Acinetobacter pittii]MBJ8431827.1 hypothetical protein [Acinetobacter pittii]
MKINKDLTLSLLIYLISVGGLTLSDLIVVSSFSHDSVSQWAFFKSVIFVLGGLCIFGFDQLLLREASYYIEIKKQFWLQSIFLSAVSSFFLFLYLHSVFETILCFFILVFYSTFLFEASYWRGQGKLLISQLYTNLWKLFLFAVLFIIIVLKMKENILNIYFSSIVLSFFILMIFKFFLINKNDISSEKVTTKERVSFFILGFYFFVHNISLVMANYGEQFLINLFHRSRLSADIFTYITLYASLALAAISFVGFYLGPLVRNNKNFNLENYYYYFKCLILLSVVTLLINSVIIVFLKPIFFKELEFDPILWLLTLFMTFFRVIYILPSLCLGVFGSEKVLMKSSFYTFTAVIIYIVIFSLLLQNDSKKIVYVLMCLMSVHWLFKLILSNYFVHLSLSKLKSEA